MLNELIEAKSQVSKLQTDYAEIINETLDIFANIINKQPTLDVAPVVRCKECVCCSRWNDQLVCSRISGVIDGYYHGTVDVVKPDDYCSHGIRKTAKPLDVKMGAK